MYGESTEGWVKLPKPNMIESSPEALEYYKTSNQEDLYFMNKEMQACIQWFKKNHEEIIKAEKYNAQL